MTRGRTEIPVVLCLDVEPDARTFDPQNPGGWDGFERWIETVPLLRERLSQATGAPAAFTWALRMDPQVADTWGSPTWVTETYGDVFAGFLECGDELGLHTHDWRWDSDLGDWISRDHDPAWGEHSMGMAFDAFEEAFGHPCAAHRGGDHFLSEAMFSFLRERGVKVDMTVEPGKPPAGAAAGEHVHSATPDYRVAPPRPYRSSPGRFPAPDPASDDDPLLMPMCSAMSRSGRRLPLPIHHGSRRFALRLAVELLRDPPPVLAFSMRSDMAIKPGWATVEKNLEHLAGHRRMTFVTASAAAKRFQGANGSDRDAAGYRSASPG
ncbi:MAG: hypothetical protein AABM29_01360 [Actinomycetota bacterium]